MWLSQSLEDQKIWSNTTNYAGCIIHKPSGLVVACCQVIPVKVLPLKRWLIRHPNLLKYEREYSKILVTNFVASDEIASFKPTIKCRFWRWTHVTFLDDISHHTCLALFPRRAQRLYSNFSHYGCVFTRTSLNCWSRKSLEVQWKQLVLSLAS